MKRIFCFDSEIGKLWLAEEDGALTDISFAADIKGAFLTESSSLLQQAACQLQEYLRGDRQDFSLPLALQGTPFQQRVWQALLQIPYGQTRTYGQIAQMIGSPKACRAVGMANHNNPVAIVVPCHRVIGADGSLTGYSAGVSLKKKLLELEGIGIVSPAEKK